jgi:hypothetical protein
VERYELRQEYQTIPPASAVAQMAVFTLMITITHSGNFSTVVAVYVWTLFAKGLI